MVRRFLFLRKPDKKRSDWFQTTSSRFLIELSPDFLLTILFEAETEDGAHPILVFEVRDDNVVDGEDGLDVDGVSSPISFVFRPSPDELALLLVLRTPNGNREVEFVGLEKDQKFQILRSQGLTLLEKISWD